MDSGGGDFAMKSLYYVYTCRLVSFDDISHSVAFDSAFSPFLFFTQKGFLFKR